MSEDVEGSETHLGAPPRPEGSEAGGESQSERVQRERAALKLHALIKKHRSKILAGARRDELELTDEERRTRVVEKLRKVRRRTVSFTFRLPRLHIRMSRGRIGCLVRNVGARQPAGSCWLFRR